MNLIKTFFLLLVLMVIACSKDKVYDDPYAGGKEPLGVKLSTDPPSPNDGAPGAVIAFKGTGLLKHRDSIH
ncbi:MAG TPA: DUF5008 domain-containing protein, partial [Chitinophaga sp.]|nr:DUF5008 domain-containing protein [Chitinophaga sp.]